MDTASLDLRGLSDAELLARVRTCARDERRATATLIDALAEMDARRLYLGQGCSSLFTYCTQVLHLSEHAAYGRIEAARASRKCPLVLQLLADGEITLTTITLLAPHLTTENHRELLDSARHKSKREVEHMVAALRPLPDVPSVVRKVTTAKTAAKSVLRALVDSEPTEETRAPMPDARPAVAVPLAPERYKIQFTASHETYEKLRRQCAFVGVAGRCRERAFLEFHHVRPFAQGGDGRAENIELRCRAHNRYDAEQYFWAEQRPT